MFEFFNDIRADFSLLNRRAIFALVYTAVGLTCIYYLKEPAYLIWAFKNTRFAGLAEWVAYSPDNNLPSLTYWVFISVLFYLAVPAFALKFVFGQNLRDYGVNFTIERGFWPLLAKCIVVMLPLVYLMSLTSGFSSKYPFLKVYNDDPYLSSTLLIWEAVYFLQFFGLEFFFRGFLLHSLKPSLGTYSIFVMMMPYAMIHFGKPMPEAFAAIFAGIFLGWLSYKNGNIWMGLVLHCTVAFSMDILALFNKGLLF